MEENKNTIHANFKVDVKPFLDGFYERLLLEFEKENIIVPVLNTKESFYKLNFNQLASETSKIILPKDIFKQLFEFQTIIRSIFYNLKYPDSESSRDLKLSQVMLKLEERGAFPAPWKNNQEVISIFDKMNNLSGDDIKVKEAVEKTINENKINLSSLISRLLEFYGIEKALNYFIDFNYKKPTSINKEVDLVLSNQNFIYPNLIFEFKHRKKIAIPSRDTILKALHQLQEFTQTDNINAYFFLVIFTDQELGTFDKAKFQFDQILKEFENHTEFINRIKFVPVALNYLNLIDDEFDEFKNKFIEQKIQFSFRNQQPPKNYPSRNDHFFDRNFDFKKINFEIIINPIQAKFWRFGFKFSPTDQFPLITDDRHVLPTADVHLSVGDLFFNGIEPVWGKSNQFGMPVYHVEVIEDAFSGINNYQGEPVSFSIKANDDGSKTTFSVTIKDKVTGYKVVNLSKFKLCRIYAWCDFGQFQLDTEIKVIHKKNQS